MTTALDALRQTDDLLGYITANYAAGHRAIIDALPGISGRPVGSGLTGGGSNVSDGTDEEPQWGKTTVVERCALIQGHEERRSLARYEALPGLCVSACDELAGVMGVPAIAMPDRRTAGQQWAWSSWIIVLCRGLADQHGARVPEREMLEVHNLVTKASAMVHAWTGRVVPAITDANAELVTDLTETWCRRHLKYGQREPRDATRYPIGVCRWCGDFKAHNGWWPTEALLDARSDGHKITEAMIRAEKKIQKIR